MKQRVLGGLLALAAATLLGVVPAQAQDDDKVTITGRGYARAEYLEDFDDFNSDLGNSLDFTTYRLGLGFSVDISEKVKGFAEVQAHGVWGDSEVRATGDPLSGGIAVTPDTPEEANLDSILLYQGYLDLMKVGGSNVSLRIGRQEHVLGNELHMGDNDFYFGQFFDGVRAMWDLAKVDVDAFWYTIEERDVIAPLSAATPGSNDSTLTGVTAKFGVADGHSIEPYILYAREGDPGASYALYTYGALYMRPPGEGHRFDWSVEAALQSGDIEDTGTCPGGAAECDASSYVGEGEFGFSFGQDQRHRAHVGAFILGDGDDPQDVEFFIELFPDTHRRLGVMDMFTANSTSAIASTPGDDTFHNITSLNVGWDYMGERHGFSAAYHDFQFTEDFGGPADAYGQELDGIWNFKYDEKVGIEVGAGLFMPDDDTFLMPNDEDAMRVWAMLKLNANRNDDDE